MAPKRSLKQLSKPITSKPAPVRAKPAVEKWRFKQEFGCEAKIGKNKDKECPTWTDGYAHTLGFDLDVIAMVCYNGKRDTQDQYSQLCWYCDKHRAERIANKEYPGITPKTTVEELEKKYGITLAKLTDPSNTKNAIWIAEEQKERAVTMNDKDAQDDEEEQNEQEEEPQNKDEEEPQNEETEEEQNAEVADEEDSEDVPETESDEDVSESDEEEEEKKPSKAAVQKNKKIPGGGSRAAAVQKNIKKKQPGGGSRAVKKSKKNTGGSRKSKAAESSEDEHDESTEEEDDGDESVVEQSAVVTVVPITQDQKDAHKRKQAAVTQRTQEAAKPLNTIKAGVERPSAAAVTATTAVIAPINVVLSVKVEDVIKPLENQPPPTNVPLFPMPRIRMHLQTCGLKLLRPVADGNEVFRALAAVYGVDKVLDEDLHYQLRCNVMDLFEQNWDQFSRPFAINERTNTQIAAGHADLPKSGVLQGKAEFIAYYKQWGVRPCEAILNMIGEYYQVWIRFWEASSVSTNAKIPSYCPSMLNKEEQPKCLPNHTYPPGIDIYCEEVSSGVWHSFGGKIPPFIFHVLLPIEYADHHLIADPKQDKLHKTWSRKDMDYIQTTFYASSSSASTTTTIVSPISSSPTATTTTNETITITPPASEPIIPVNTVVPITIPSVVVDDSVISAATTTAAVIEPVVVSTSPSDDPASNSVSVTESIMISEPTTTTSETQSDVPAVPIVSAVSEVISTHTLSEVTTDSTNSHLLIPLPVTHLPVVPPTIESSVEPPSSTMSD